MSNPFFDHPILNSPYEYPQQHWELDSSGQPTQRIIERRRRAEFITPIPKPKKRKTKRIQPGLVFDEGKGLSTKEQQYDPTSIINDVRGQVATWRKLPRSSWQVTPESARLLIRERARTLRINYRTSHQIRQQADRLLGPEMTDVDGNVEYRSDAISVFNGPAPIISVVGNEGEEIRVVGGWLSEQAKAGIQPHEFGVFVRSTGQLERAQDAVKEAGLPFKILDERVETTSGHVSISTMHLAKGLEFRSVAVMACDDEIIPLQERIEAWATMRTYKKFTTRSATSSTSHAHAREIICL